MRFGEWTELSKKKIPRRGKSGGENFGREGNLERKKGDCSEN